MEIINFRDVGGLKTTDGRQVKPHFFLRGADLRSVSDEDYETLFQTYHLGWIIDLRTQEEARRAPDRVLAPASYLFLPVREKLDSFINGDIAKLNASYPVKLATAIQQKQVSIDRLLEYSYAFLIESEFARAQYAKMLDLIYQMARAGDQRSFYLHCSAGKDRTGLGMLFILSALGVDQAEIEKDYLSTNEDRFVSAKVAYFQDELRTHGFTDQQVVEEAIRSITVNQHWFQITLDTIKARYGSMDSFLKEGLKLSSEKLKTIRSFYLEGKNS